MNIVPLDVIEYIFGFIQNDYELLRLRCVNKDWNLIVTSTHIPIMLKYLDDYANSMRLHLCGNRVKFMYLLRRSSYYSFENDVFTGLTFTQTNGNVGEDLRCCAFTTSGRRCSKRFTQNTRMCLTHHKKYRL